MKEIILLVGPQGAGKTTLCNLEYKDYFRISQDDQGKKGHFDLFLDLIKKDVSKIIIDRINHLEKQRTKYIEIAKKNGYETKIVVLNEKIDICLDRIETREKHPTLNSKEDGIKALRLYFREYEIPKKDEADKVEFLNEYDPYLIDLTDKYENYLIIGDVHGCFDEMKELIEKPLGKEIDEKTAIIFIGDLFDKGEKIKEVWEFFKSKNNVFSIKGNHEEKLIRYLRGNNINISGGLDKTIDQLNLDNINTSYAKELLNELESFPMIIKINNNYLVHAGIHPKKNILRQKKEHLLYIRHFNEKNQDFFDDTQPYWFEEYEGENNIFFGHDFHKSIEIKKNVFSLDGYCVYGNELRACLIQKNKKEFFRVKAKKKYYESFYEKNDNTISPYEILTLRGFLNKDENQELALFNYSDKCVYEKKWDKYTKSARGLIFNKKTQEIVARPFIKFFNLGENDESRIENLPKDLTYEIYDKLDGSLGILYYFNNEWRISTRGKIESEQSKIAKEILKKYNLKNLNKEYTYMVEIIYPQNKIVINYGDDKKLVLLAGIHTKDSSELSYEELKLISKESKLELVEKYNYTINEILELKEKKDFELEGFVIKFSNNLRVKVKGEEYLKIAKLIANISPISIWETMESGIVDKKYLEKVPEEFESDVQRIVNKLESKYKKIQNEINQEFDKLENKENIKESLNEIQEKKLKHKLVLISKIKKENKKIEKYIMNIIRPKNNEI